jgi:PAS domain S-box-containing protein
MAGTSDRPIRVLHLEDDPRDAEIIAHRLRGEGLGAGIVVARGREAFESALALEPFDLILCDYNLPGYDGMRGIARARAAQPGVPVIVISGTVGEDEAIHCLQAGATDYLLKSRLERLGPAIRRAMEEAEQRRQRHRAETALQERERRLSSIYAAVADMLLYLAVEGEDQYRILSANPAFEAAVGLPDHQIAGSPIDDVLPPSAATLDGLARAVRERRTVRWEDTWELGHRRLTGEVSMTPIFDEEGRCTHLVGAIHDVTERRELEAQLRHAQRMESVGQLAGGIAHDFNNLLTVINGLADMLILQLDGSGGELEHDLREIRDAGERASALTRQLLAFSRRQILQPEIIDIDATVADISSMLRRLLGEDIHLDIVLGGGSTVMADRGQLEQVIANLAVNARDAMPGGGTLTIETAAITLKAKPDGLHGAAIKPGPHVVMTVRDTGTGMDARTRRRMFEPFFTTKGPGQGTGLGLSTVYGIVSQSGGAIAVDSEPGRGTQFTIYLPRAVESGAASRPEPAAGPVRGTETILVAEDMAGLRRLICRTLETAGYTVLPAANGTEAMALIEQHHGPIHLLITDVVMPGMSGRTLAERLAQRRPETKVLYMSGYTEDVMVRHNVLDGSSPFISKPFRMSDLTRVVRRTLDEPARLR